MNDNSRRYFSPEQKVAILREHLIEGKAVSDLCDKYEIHPTVFYQWQRQLFESPFHAEPRQMDLCRVEASKRHGVYFVIFDLARRAAGAEIPLLLKRIRQSNPPSGRGVFLMHCRHDGNRSD